MWLWFVLSLTHSAFSSVSNHFPPLWCSVHAPVMRVFAALVFISSFVGILTGASAYPFNVAHAHAHPQQLLSLVYMSLAAPSFWLTSLVLAALYYLSVVERIMGSQKTAFLLVVSVLLYHSAVVALVVTVPAPASRFFALRGPGWSVVALFVVYMLHVPLYRPPNAVVSNKFLVTLLVALYLAFDFVHTALGAAVGLVAALLYSANVCHIADLRFPRSVTTFFEDYIFPVFSSSPVPPNFPQQQQQQFQPQPQQFQMTPDQYRALRTALGDVYAASDVLPGEQARQQQQQQPFNDDGSDEGFEQLPVVEPDPDAVGLSIPHTQTVHSPLMLLFSSRLCAQQHLFQWGSASLWQEMCCANATTTWLSLPTVFSTRSSDSLHLPFRS